MPLHFVLYCAPDLGGRLWASVGQILFYTESCKRTEGQGGLVAGGSTTYKCCSASVAG